MNAENAAISSPGERMTILPGTISILTRPSASARLTLAAGFDAAAVRLTGNVVGQAPFTGTLMHRGWRVAEITLPKLAEGHDARVLAPAEVAL